MSRLGAAAAPLALLLVSCGGSAGSGAVQAGPTSVPAPVASPSAPPADPAGLLVAVRRASGGLELHRVDRDRRTAALERVLEPPDEGADVLDVTMGSGQDPVVCATWHTGPTTVFEDKISELICYAARETAGRPVAGVYRPVHVALNATGDRVAWAELDEGGNQAIGAGVLRDGELSGLRRFVARPGQPEEGEQAFTGTAVQDLAWLDDDHVLLSTVVESDDGPALLRFDVTVPGARGWLDEGERVVSRDAGYVTFESVVTTDGTTALAVQRGSFVADDSPPPSRAVRVDLATGRVLQVVATAAAGRNVVGVSGGEPAVVYTTAAGFDQPVRAYVRRAGEAKGTPITGLPADARDVLAQSEVSGRSG